MRTVNVHEAKTHFSKLLDAAMSGEDIIIVRAGNPCVRLVPILTTPRKPGALEGKGSVPDSFFEPLTENEAGGFK